MATSVVNNIDNMLGMSAYGDKHFDLALVDPPYFEGPNKRGHYGSSISTQHVKRVYYPIIDNKDWQIPRKEFFDEVVRVSKNQIIWGCNYFDYQFGPGRIVWDKVNGDSSFSDCEIAYCSMHDSVRLFRYMWNGMMQGKSISEGHIMQGNKKLNEKRIHSTQKPVALYKWLLMKYADKGFKILDTNVGSGSSRIAAFDYDLEYVGYEINNEVFNLQEERFKKHTNNQRINFSY